MQEGDSGESNSREGGRDKGTGDERSRCDRWKDEWKNGSESSYDQTEVNNKDDDRKKRDRKERNNRESGRGKVSNQGDAKRRSYSEAVIEGALRTERVFMGDSILRKTDRILSKGEDVVVCLPGARIEHVTERVENVLGHGQGGSILVNVGTNNADRDGTTRIVNRYRELVETLKKTRVEHIILSGILPVMRGRGTTFRNCKRMAINALLEQMCEEEGVGFVDLWGYLVGKEDMYMRDGLHLSGKGAAVFSENIDKDSKKTSAKNSLESPTEFGYKCVCLNTRSRVNKRNELNIMVEDIDPHIIGITESWATPDISDAELGMTGYVMFRKDRLGRRGDGVILYIKESIQAYEIKLEKEAECEEAVWCNIVTGNSTVTVGLVYRNPNISMEENEKIRNAIK